MSPKQVWSRHEAGIAEALPYTLTSTDGDRMKMTVLLLLLLAGCAAPKQGRAPGPQTDPATEYPCPADPTEALEEVRPCVPGVLP